MRDFKWKWLNFNRLQITKSTICFQGQVSLIVAISLFFLNSLSIAGQNGSILAEDILAMSFEEMLRVKITTAGKKSEKISEIPASAVIITRMDIEKYGYMTLEEILENVPGMYVIDHPAYRETHGIRGYYAGAPRNIIFLVNGVPQTDGVFDYNILSNFQIPVEAIDKIEVVRGPMSVIYGQGAFFGAINIITNDPADETRLISLSMGNGVKKSAAVMNGNKGDFQFSFSAAVSDSDGSDYALDESVSDMSTLEMWGIDASNNTTNDRLERDAKNFLFSGRYNQFYTEMSFNQSVDEVFAFKPSVTTGSPYDREMVKLTLGYKDQVTDYLKLNGKITFHHFSFHLDWDINSILFDGDDAGQTNAESDVYEVELDAFWDLAEKLHMTTGLYCKVSSDTKFIGELPIFNLESRTETMDDITSWAFFAQLHYSPWDKFRIVSGIRLEQLFDYTILHENYLDNGMTETIEGIYGSDSIDLIPSMAVIYTPDKNNIFKLFYGEALANPSFYQNRDQLLDGFPSLDVEKIRTVELNYLMMPFPGITAHFSLFRNTLDNLIVRSISIQADELSELTSNGGKLTTNGTELTIQWNVRDNFFIETSLTYQQTEDERAGFEDIDVAYSPHLLGYLKMSYAFNDNVILALTGTYVDKMETEWDTYLNNYAGARIGEAVDDYFLLGVNLRINDIFGKDYYLNIRGSNILDTSYLYPTYVTNTWADKGTPGDPMKFLVTMGKKF